MVTVAWLLLTMVERSELTMAFLVVFAQCTRLLQAKAMTMMGKLAVTLLVVPHGCGFFKGPPHAARWVILCAIIYGHTNSCVNNSC